MRTESLAAGSHRFGRRWFFGLLGGRSYRVDVAVDQDRVKRWLQPYDGSLTVVAVIAHPAPEF